MPKTSGATSEVKEVTFTTERVGDLSEPMTRKFPTINCGVCEFCGSLDGRYKGAQYELCQHYKNMPHPLRCTYCDPATDPEDVIRSRVLHVWEHPDKAGVLIVCCNDTKCETKHQRRFRRGE